MSDGNLLLFTYRFMDTETFVARVVRPLLGVSLLVGGAFAAYKVLNPTIQTGQVQSGISFLPSIPQPPVSLEATKLALGGRPLVIRGSTSAADLIPILRTKFEEQKVGLNSLMLGSDKGLAALRSGEADIAFSSKPVTEAGLVTKEVTTERVVLFVGINNPIRLPSLSSEVACGIYRGNIQRWNELGANGPVRFYDRSNGGTLEWIRHKCGTRTAAAYRVLPDGTTRLFSLLAEDPLAVGYGSERQAQTMVRTVPIDGWERKIFAVYRADSAPYLESEVVPRMIQVLKP